MEEERGERKHTENNTGKGTILGETEDARPSREGKQGQQKQRKRPGLPPWGLGPAGMYFYPNVPVHIPHGPCAVAKSSAAQLLSLRGMTR